MIDSAYKKHVVEIYVQAASDLDFFSVSDLLPAGYVHSGSGTTASLFKKLQDILYT